MSNPDWKKVEGFLRKTFNAPEIKIVTRKTDEESVEVFKGEEFIGLVYIDEDEGETSYMFEMAILEIDLD